MTKIFHVIGLEVSILIQFICWCKSHCKFNVYVEIELKRKAV